MNKTLISVIVPVYNVEKYLNQCLESITYQTYKEFEVILVDDGSTDGSSDICQKYVKKDYRFKYFYKENGGLSDARNYGVDKSVGEYLTFIDSDDFIDIDYLKELYYNLIEQNVDISTVNNRRIDDSGKIYEDITNEKNMKISNYEALEYIFYQKYISISSCAKLYKRKIIEKNKFPIGFLYEDIYSVPRFFIDANKIYCSSKTLLNYRIREGSITQSSFKKKDFDMIKNAINVYALLKKDTNFKINSIYSYIVSKASTLLFLLYDSELERDLKNKYINEIWDYIKKYRIQVLFDNKARMMNRIACVVSFFGVHIYNKIYKLKRRD